MAKIVNDISDTFSAITDTLSKSASSRWMAPELIHEDNVELTFACDVWSFGMTMLELFTMDRPWAELKREAHVHRAMGDGDKPARPKSCHGLTDHIWTVMVECWERHAINRPAMGTVTSNIQCEDRNHCTSFLWCRMPGRSRSRLKYTRFRPRGQFTLASTHPFRIGHSMTCICTAYKSNLYLCIGQLSSHPCDSLALRSRLKPRGPIQEVIQVGILACSDPIGLFPPGWTSGFSS